MQIDEPIGFDAAAFVVQQDKDRYGRDVSFSGEEIDFTFSNIKNIYGHYFEKLVQYDTIYGFESQVQYIIEDNGVEYIVGDIDFVTKESDQIKRV